MNVPQAEDPPSVRLRRRHDGDPPRARLKKAAIKKRGRGTLITAGVRFAFLALYSQGLSESPSAVPDLSAEWAAAAGKVTGAIDAAQDAFAAVVGGAGGSGRRRVLAVRPRRDPVCL